MEEKFDLPHRISVVPGENRVTLGQVKVLRQVGTDARPSSTNVLETPRGSNYCFQNGLRWPVGGER